MSRYTRYVLRSFGLGIALMSVAYVSLAQSPASGPAAARALFDQGRALLDAGDWAGACRKFDESLAISPNVSTSIKVARCRVHEGKLATAAKEYERARALNQRETVQGSAHQAELAATIERETNDLAPRIPSLRILVLEAPAGLTVHCNGALVEPLRLGQPLPVDPGNYEVTAEAPGWVTESKTVTVAERTVRDQVVEISFRLTPARPTASQSPSRPESTPVPPGPPVRAPQDGTATPPAAPVLASTPALAVTTDSHPSERHPNYTTGFVIGGVGVVALGAAGVLGILTLNRVGASKTHCQHPGDTCDEYGVRLRNQASDLQTAGLITAGIGAAALFTGIVLVVTAKDQRPAVALSLDPRGITGSVPW
jgi:hypothetical protein